MNEKELQKDTRNLLIVEDEAISREILRLILETESNVIFAEDGTEALQKLQEYRNTLSLILLDLIMPNMSGMEVLTRIRAVPVSVKVSRIDLNDPNIIYELLGILEEYRLDAISIEWGNVQVKLVFDVSVKLVSKIEAFGGWKKGICMV